MQIVVSELPVGDAAKRARQRFERADRRLAEVLAGDTRALPWMVAGALATAAGTLGLPGLSPLPGELAPLMGVLAAVGGACLGYALPLWSRARAAKRRRTREWHHALEMLRLREQQAEEDPELTVEVLDRVDRQHPLLISKWNARTSAAAGYVQ
jgi:hypothetical protein